MIRAVLVIVVAVTVAVVAVVGAALYGMAAGHCEDDR